MALSAFDDNTAPPREKELAAELARRTRRGTHYGNT